MADSEELLLISDAAKLLGTDEESVRAALRAKLLPGFRRSGGSSPWLIRRADLERYIEVREDEAAEAARQAEIEAGLDADFARLDAEREAVAKRSRGIVVGYGDFPAAMGRVWGPEGEAAGRAAMDRHELLRQVAEELTNPELEKRFGSLDDAEARSKAARHLAAEAFRRYLIEREAEQILRDEISKYESENETEDE